jgi:arylsulfatase A-like enzyme
MPGPLACSRLRRSLRPLRRFSALALAFGLADCSAPPTAKAPAGPKAVILVSVDTLRADHLGAYGYGKPTSPHIDRLAEQGVTFARTSAHAPSTLLSHASIFTSRIPQQHAASHIRNLPLSEVALTLTEVLRDAGYATASYNSGGQLMRSFGLAQGFEVYESGPDTFLWAVEQGLAWLDGRPPADASRPFFLFLHTYEPHHPYTPSLADLELFAVDYRGPLSHLIPVELLVEVNQGRRRLTDADLAYVIAAYDAEIHATDRAFGRLLEGLAARGLLDSSLIVLTSDHGEEFGEHGMVGWHSHTLNEELLRVPLILRMPGRAHAGSRIDRLARSIDIAPTVLEALGLPAPREFAGRSLLPAVRGEEQPELPSVAAWDTPQQHYFEALTTRRLKLNDGKVFDLQGDPGEKVDLAFERPALRAELERALRSAVEARPALAGAPPTVLSEEELRRLESLGYVR